MNQANEKLVKEEQYNALFSAEEQTIIETLNGIYSISPEYLFPLFHYARKLSKKLIIVSCNELNSKIISCQSHTDKLLLLLGTISHFDLKSTFHCSLSRKSVVCDIASFQSQSLLYPFLLCTWTYFPIATITAPATSKRRKYLETLLTTTNHGWLEVDVGSLLFLRPPKIQHPLKLSNPSADTGKIKVCIEGTVITYSTVRAVKASDNNISVQRILYLINAFVFNVSGSSEKHCQKMHTKLNEFLGTSCWPTGYSSSSFSPLSILLKDELSYSFTSQLEVGSRVQLFFLSPCRLTSQLSPSAPHPSSSRVPGTSVSENPLQREKTHNSKKGFSVSNEEEHFNVITILPSPVSVDLKRKPLSMKNIYNDILYRDYNYFLTKKNMFSNALEFQTHYEVNFTLSIGPKHSILPLPTVYFHQSFEDAQDSFTDSINGGKSTAAHRGMEEKVDPELSAKLRVQLHCSDLVGKYLAAIALQMERRGMRSYRGMMDILSQQVMEIVEDLGDLEKVKLMRKSNPLVAVEVVLGPYLGGGRYKLMNARSKANINNIQLGSLNVCEWGTSYSSVGWSWRAGTILRAYNIHLVRSSEDYCNAAACEREDGRCVRSYDIHACSFSSIYTCRLSGYYAPIHMPLQGEKEERPFGAQLYLDVTTITRALSQLLERQRRYSSAQVVCSGPLCVQQQELLGSYQVASDDGFRATSQSLSFVYNPVSGSKEDSTIPFAFFCHKHMSQVQDTLSKYSSALLKSFSHLSFGGNISSDGSTLLHRISTVEYPLETLQSYRSMWVNLLNRSFIGTKQWVHFLCEIHKCLLSAERKRIYQDPGVLSNHYCCIVCSEASPKSSKEHSQCSISICVNEEGPVSFQQTSSVFYAERVPRLNTDKDALEKLSHSKIFSFLSSETAPLLHFITAPSLSDMETELSLVISELLAQRKIPGSNTLLVGGKSICCIRRMWMSLLEASPIAEEVHPSSDPVTPKKGGETLGRSFRQRHSTLKRSQKIIPFHNLAWHENWKGDTSMVNGDNGDDLLERINDCILDAETVKQESLSVGGVKRQREATPTLTLHGVAVDKERKEGLQSIKLNDISTREGNGLNSSALPRIEERSYAMKQIGDRVRWTVCWNLLQFHGLFTIFCPNKAKEQHAFPMWYHDQVFTLIDTSYALPVVLLDELNVRKMHSETMKQVMRKKKATAFSTIKEVESLMDTCTAAINSLTNDSHCTNKEEHLFHCPLSYRSSPTLPSMLVECGPINGLFVSERVRTENKYETTLHMLFLNRNNIVPMSLAPSSSHPKYLSLWPERKLRHSSILASVLSPLSYHMQFPENTSKHDKIYGTITERAHSSIKESQLMSNSFNYHNSPDLRPTGHLDNPTSENRTNSCMSEIFQSHLYTIILTKQYSQSINDKSCITTVIQVKWELFHKLQKHFHDVMHNIKDSSTQPSHIPSSSNHREHFSNFPPHVPLQTDAQNKIKRSKNPFGKKIRDLEKYLQRKVIRIDVELFKNLRPLDVYFLREKTEFHNMTLWTSVEDMTREEDTNIQGKTTKSDKPYGDPPHAMIGNVLAFYLSSLSKRNASEDVSPQEVANGEKSSNTFFNYFYNWIVKTRVIQQIAEHILQPQLSGASLPVYLSEFQKHYFITGASDVMRIVEKLTDFPIYISFSHWIVLDIMKDLQRVVIRVCHTLTPEFGAGWIDILAPIETYHVWSLLRPGMVISVQNLSVNILRERQNVSDNEPSYLETSKAPSCPLPFWSYKSVFDRVNASAFPTELYEKEVAVKSVEESFIGETAQTDEVTARIMTGYNNNAYVQESIAHQRHLSNSSQFLERLYYSQQGLNPLIVTPHAWMTYVELPSQYSMGTKLTIDSLLQTTNQWCNNTHAYSNAPRFFPVHLIKFKETVQGISTRLINDGDWKNGLPQKNTSSAALFPLRKQIIQTPAKMDEGQIRANISTVGNSLANFIVESVPLYKTIFDASSVQLSNIRIYDILNVYGCFVCEICGRKITRNTTRGRCSSCHTNEIYAMGTSTGEIESQESLFSQCRAINQFSQGGAANNIGKSQTPIQVLTRGIKLQVLMSVGDALSPYPMKTLAVFENEAALSIIDFLEIYHYNEEEQGILSTIYRMLQKNDSADAYNVHFRNKSMNLFHMEYTRSFHTLEFNFKRQYNDSNSVLRIIRIQPITAKQLLKASRHPKQVAR